MKVVQLSRFDGGDGAANAAYRLHTGLRRLGHDSTMVVAESRRDGNDPCVQVVKRSGDLLERVRRRLRRERIAWSLKPYAASRPTTAEAFSDDRVPHTADLLRQLPPCDIVHIHSMYEYIDFESFFNSVPRHTPVVRTMHDMSFFTGGCHLDAGCGRYKDRCGACPQLGSSDANDLSRHIWQRKYASLERVAPDRLHIVAPSNWLADQARRSSLLEKFPISVIPLGVDTEVFCPRDRRCARDVVGVQDDTHVVLFVAEPVYRPIKRFALLAEAMSGLRSRDKSVVITVGRGKPPVELQVPHLHLGQIRNERFLSFIYSAADVLVISSRQENFPLTALEALACGTPVIAFAVGGIPDIVRPGVTGLLVPPDDVTALGAAIEDLLRDPARRAEMSVNCRRIATDEYTLERQARNYVGLYEKLLSSS